MAKKSYTLKTFINDIHLWLGIASGVVLFLVCLSGTILTFEKEIKSALAETLEVTPNEGGALPMETLIANLIPKGQVLRVTIPAEINQPYVFRVKTSPSDRRGTVVYVNPFTGAALQPEKGPLDAFFMSMFKMHRWMLMDISIGRPIVGVATIIFLILSVTGLVLWFPKKLSWKQFKPRFKIKWSASWKRINYDLHNTLGFYACIFLIIMALTGLNWSFDWYRAGASQVLGAKVFDRSQPQFSLNASEAPELPLKNILTVVNQSFDYKGDVTLSLPSEKADFFTIRKQNAKGFSPVVSNRLVVSKQGEVLFKEIFSEKPWNAQIAALIKPIHTGEIFGSFSKVIYFFGCLIATSLPITGTLIWLNKLKKKRKKKKAATV